MKAIILAAGYATRLYPLTLTTPKPLLKIGEKRIIDRIFDEVEKIPEIDEIFIISNHKFYDQFADWKRSKTLKKPVKIIDDGTVDDEGKLGAIRDINLVLKQESVSDDVMVLAGDIVFTFSLTDFYSYYQRNNRDTICVYEVKEINDLKRMAVVNLDAENRVLELEEKPQNPKSNIGATAFYIYKRDTLPLFGEYIRQGNNLDAPGYFTAWLYKIKEVRAYRIQGECYDIGTPDSYREVQKLFSK
jgi:glucose-1-phosphate thymidylyltransferase